MTSLGTDSEELLMYVEPLQREEARLLLKELLATECKKAAIEELNWLQDLIIDLDLPHTSVRIDERRATLSPEGNNG
jgi:hypothetical protein